MFKELFTEALPIRPHEEEMGKELEKLSNTKKIAGKDFQFKFDKWNIPTITFTYGDKNWNVGFYEAGTEAKAATEISITSDDRRGSTEKKFTGRNADLKKIIDKISKFFLSNGSWK